MLMIHECIYDSFSVMIWQGVRCLTRYQTPFLNQMPLSRLYFSKFDFDRKHKVWIVYGRWPSWKILLHFFFPLLIAPSNLLDLVYPVVEETAVCETYGRNPMEKKSAREMKQPCQHITITWLLRKSQPFSASFQTQTKYVLILTVSCIIMDLIFFLN